MIIDIGAGTNSVNFHKGGGKAVKVEDNKAVKYTENGTFEIAPSDGYDAIKGAEVKVEVTKPVEKFVVPNGMKFGYSKDFDATKFDTSNVTDMSDMFHGCKNSMDLQAFDTSNATTMRGMFEDFIGTSLDISSFVTTKVTDMTYLFYYAQNLWSIDLSSFDTTSVQKINPAFYVNPQLTEIILSSKFFNSTSLTTYDFSDASNWTEKTSLATLVDALPQLTTTKTIKLSTKTKNALTDEQKTTITDKGWTIA